MPGSKIANDLLGVLFAFNFYSASGGVTVADSGKLGLHLQTNPAVWIANGRRTAAIALGILLLVLFIPNHYLLWEKFPVWYHLTFLVSLFPLTLLGATLKLPGGRGRRVTPLRNSA